MQPFYRIIPCIALWLVHLTGFAQGGQDSKSQYDVLIENANRYSEVALYAESIAETRKAIETAIAEGNRENEVAAKIDLAELMRKTQSFDRGIEVLYQLENTQQFPKLHVRKLGRLAALYAESANPDIVNRQDSVLKFLDEGITLSISLNLPLEEAGMRNELGFLNFRNGKQEEGLKDLEQAAVLFRENGDKQNEIAVATNIMEAYVHTGEYDKADSLSQLLLEAVEGTEWYDAQSRIYSILGRRHHDHPLLQAQWESRAHDATVKTTLAVNSNQMAAFRIIHDTEKFQREAADNAAALKRQEERTKELIIYLSILTLLVLGVVFLLLRERRLKRRIDKTASALNDMNEKYHMLIVESNHRIKNNLQMIVSMMRMAEKDLGEMESTAFKQITTKIHTISTLHKHLYLDVHNEYVSLDIYFNEIVSLYDDLASSIFSINLSIAPVKIRSERIIYFGLIFNELLSNTIAHSAAEFKSVQVKVSEADGAYLFDYEDQSPHLSTGKAGTGSQLIQQLVKRLKGDTYSIDEATGRTTFRFGV